MKRIEKEIFIIRCMILNVLGKIDILNMFLIGCDYYAILIYPINSSSLNIK